MKANEHFVWADIVRSLAIFIVVYIHTRPNVETVSQFSWLISILNLSSAICISLFVLLSGALLLSKQEKSIIFVRKRIVKIFIPWIFWAAIWFIFDYHSTIQNSHNYFLIARGFFRYFLSGFWFLPIIIGIYLFTPMLRLSVVKLTTNNLIFILILWFLLIILFPIFLLYHGIYNPSNTVLTILQFLGIYLLGYTIIDRYKPSKFLVLWIAVFFIGIFAAFIQLQLWHKITLDRLEAFPYNFLSPEFIAASVGIFITIYILFNGKYKNSLNHSVTNVISHIARATFGIYLTHGIFIRLYDKSALPTFFPLEKTVVVFVLTYLFIIALSKIPYIKWLAA